MRPLPVLNGKYRIMNRLNKQVRTSVFVVMRFIARSEGV